MERIRCKTKMMFVSVLAALILMPSEWSAGASPSVSLSPEPVLAQGQLQFKGISYGSGLNREYSCRLGWIPQDFPGSQAIIDVCRSNERACRGQWSLKLTVDFNVSRDGEVFLDLRMNPIPSTMAPVNLNTVTITAKIRPPRGARGDPSAPSFLQVFVKDSQFRNFIGSGVNIVEETCNMVSVTPSTGPAPPGGFKDPDFDPTNVILVGIKIGRGPRGFRGMYFLDDFTVARPQAALTIDFESSQWDNLDNVVNVCANAVTIRAAWFMDNIQSTVIAPDPSRSPTDEEVREAIRQAQARRLNVFLNPVVEVKDGSFRGDIQPTDIDQWFNSYTQFLTHFAEIARDNNVALFCVGSELKSLSGERHRARWDRVINAVRAVYSGPLTYHANWDEAPLVSFWDRVDFIAIDAFFPLSEVQNPTVEELIARWTNYRGQNWVMQIEVLQARINKPVIFTEIGYTSRDFCARRPFDPNDGGDFNADCQARAYEAAFRVFQDKPWLAGMFWWVWETWPYAGGPGNKGYTPQGKAAESVLRSFYCGH